MTLSMLESPQSNHEIAFMHIHVAPFIFATLVTNLTPGAAMLYNISMTIQRGKWHGIFAAIGVELGTLAYVLVIAFGLSELITASPLLYKSLKLCGEAYLFYLA